MALDNFQAQCDAQTLAHAEEIRQDPVRFQGARSVAGELIFEKQAQIEGLRKVQTGSGEGPVGRGSTVLNLLARYP